jgi:N-acetylglucosaminyldiphosphoundecaprenol N-acetyl-beta-D-mannosaminyltransferase
MENINKEKIDIFGVNIDKTDYGYLLSRIFIAIGKKEKLLITYANSNSLNNSYNNSEYRNLLNSFDIVHPDGVGVFIASKLLFEKNGLRKRMTGSDFYPMLIQEGVKRNWGFFFFGHDNSTLEKISSQNPRLNIKGTSEGYNFNSETIINNINKSEAEILIAGLSSPKQEIWIAENKSRLNCNVIIAVGDGIKVFAGTKKRGIPLIQKLGFEWAIRLVNNPLKYWRRYLIGNPLFLYRIIKIKLSKL